MNVDTFGNSISFLDQPIQIEVTAFLCAIGERFSPAMTCLVCEPGSYLFERYPEPHDCNLCQAEANCYGGANTAPKAGYWREQDKNLDTYYKCPYERACLGGSIEEQYAMCEVGYQGVLCGTCIAGYNAHGFMQCEECPSETMQNIFVASSLTFLVVMSVVIVRTQD